MEIKTNSFKAWVLAARPKTLSAALIPVMVAAALASKSESCSWRAITVCAVFAALMQIAANLINDLLDFLKGTDSTDRLGPERACAQGWITPKAMRWGIAVVLALALICGSLVLSLSPALPSWEGSLPLEGGFEGGWPMVNGRCLIFTIPYLLLHLHTWRQMVRIRQGRELNHILGLTSRNMLIFGILLTLALAT